MSHLKVRDLAYVRFCAPDLDEMARFGHDFGLQTAQRDAQTLYLRGAGADPVLHIMHRGPPAFLGVAFDAVSVPALAAFAQAQEVALQPLECRAGRRQDWGVGRHILVSQGFDYWLDPWGHGVEHWTDGDRMDAAWGSRVAPIQDLLTVQWGQTFESAHPGTPS